MYAAKDRKENVHLVALYGVVGSDIALYLMHLCYQQGPGASCTPSSLHPCTPILAAIYLDNLPTLITGMNTCVTACLAKSLCPQHSRTRT